jgi:hypothetical protein
MSTITFDTLEYTRRLREAGFDEKQAEAAVRVLSDAQSSLVSREYLDSRLEALEYRLTIKLGGLLAASVAIVATLVKLL